MALLEFELTHFEATIQHVSNYDVRTSITVQVNNNILSKKKKKGLLNSTYTQIYTVVIPQGEE